jgi:hypothetical protein
VTSPIFTFTNSDFPPQPASTEKHKVMIMSDNDSFFLIFILHSPFLPGPSPLLKAYADAY